MCGIAGIIDYDRHESYDAILCEMVGLIRHRGPDSFGIYEDDRAGLVSTRLSIIDLAGGDQPLCNEDGSVWVAYNGEIYNYPEIRSGLIAAGHRFRTLTDTEILVHLYEDHGSDFFNRLNGQFAFALWDSRKKSLLLGRDRLGVRPLYYAQSGRRVVFGSEIKAVFADRRISRSLDPVAISDIFTCWSPLGEKTAFSAVRQVPPAHCMIFSEGGCSIRRYWKIDFDRESDRAVQAASRPDLLKDELAELITDATRIRLRADVPVGAYLSGGLDSMLITSVVKKRFDNRLCTFSVTFTDGRFDERPFQEKAVDELQTDHRYITCTESDIAVVLPSVVWHTETAIMRSAPAPLYMLSDLVRKSGFKVVLTGEGADELFGGYDIFKEDKVRRFWARDPQSGLRPLLLKRIYPDIFGGVHGGLGGFHENFFRKSLLETDLDHYSHMIRWGNGAKLKVFFSDDLKAAAASEGEFVERYRAALPLEFRRWDPLSKAQYAEISIFLSNYLLSSQGDRMAMAHGVEGRFPYLDHRVIEFASRLPARLAISALKEKYMLRRAAEAFLSPEFASRPKKPYRAPISRCIFGAGNGAEFEELLSDGAVRRSGLFNAERVRQIVSKCRRNGGQLISERENMAVMGILSAQMLEEQFVRNFPVRSVIAIPAEIRRISMRSDTDCSGKGARLP